MTHRYIRVSIAAALFAALLPPAAIAQDFTTGPTPVSRAILNSGDASDSGVRMANAAGTWIAVWSSTEEVAGTGTDPDILFARSTDNGVTWTDPLPIASTATTDSGGFESDADIATDGNGTWVVVWRGIGPFGNALGGDADVFVSRSTDDGQTWSPVAALHYATSAADDGHEHTTRLAMDAAGNCVAVWYSGSTTGGTGADLDVWVSRSSDAGVTWTAPTPLNANATVDDRSDSYASIATDGDGVWIAAWQVDLAGDVDIRFRRSTDFGATWSAATELNTNAAADTAADTQPTLESDGAGNWIAAWTSSDLGGALGNDQDILYARSSDDGQTWSAPAPLNTNAASDDGTDQNATIVTDGSALWLALWNSDNDVDGSGDDPDIVFSRSTNGGVSWSAPHVLVTTTTDDGSGDYMSGAAGHDGAGNWVVAWWSYESLDGTLGNDIDILTTNSSDNAMTWADVAPLNSNAYSDGRETAPDIATDGSTWVAVWMSDDPLGQSVGADPNILTARSTDGGVTWSEPAHLMTNVGDDDGYDLEPQIATDGASWIAVWSTYQGRAYAARSIDDGATWSAPMELDTTPGALMNTIPHVASDGDVWVIVWQTLSSDLNGDIARIRSTDGGATWSETAFLNTNAGADAGFDHEVRVATDGTTWMAVWNSTENLDGAIGTDEDIFYATSTDDGETWSDPAWLNTNAPSDGTNPDENAVLATDDAGSWVVAWRSGGGALGNDFDILTARSSDAGQTWSAPQMLAPYATTDSGYDDNVEIAVDGLGRWAAVWDTTTSPSGAGVADKDILIVRSIDAGATWTAPERLHAHAAGDSSDDANAAVAADALGSWVVLWNSDDELDGLASGIAPNIFAVSAQGISCGDCDDGDPCTRDVCEPSGECANLDAPAVTCRTAGKSGFQLRNVDDDTKDALSWKWGNGASTSQDEFSDPTVATDYALCVFDETGRRMKLTVPGGGTCDGKPCWKKVSTKGYGYKDAAGSSNGVTGVSLKGSDSGKSKVQVKAVGADLSAATLPLSGDVTVQLVNTGSGMCWGSSFSGEQIVINDDGKGMFKAKAK